MTCIRVARVRFLRRISRTLLRMLGGQHCAGGRVARRASEGSLGDNDLCWTPGHDGLRCQFDIAFPVLRDSGITAFWFVY